MSKGLGISRDDRDTNILRIAYVAIEIVHHGGVFYCAAITLYRATREIARERIGKNNFIEVFVDTSIELCDQRDRKGLYSLARPGRLNGFTGIDDPCESPLDPEIRLETVGVSAKTSARILIDHLQQMGFIFRRESFGHQRYRTNIGPIEAYEADTSISRHHGLKGKEEKEIVAGSTHNENRSRDR